MRLSVRGMKRTPEGGFSLIEVTVASVLGALVAGGTMLAFVTATRLSHGSSDEALAADFAGQGLETYRNHVACDDGTWFASTTCAAQTTTPESNVPLPALPSGTRTVTATPADCDGDTVLGDCLQVVAKITWTPPQ